MVKVIKHEDAPENTQVVVSDDDFVTELMRGMNKRGFAAMMPPELDKLLHASDRAAVETYRYFEEQYPDVKLTFYLTYRYEPVCTQWHDLLHENSSKLFDIDTYNGVLRFANDRWPYDDKWQPPGNQAMWDDLADRFAELAKDVLRIREELR